MTTVRERGERIRKFIVNNVGVHPDDIAKVAAKKFGVTRQAIHNHLSRLVDEKVLQSHGNTRNRSYSLCPLMTWQTRFAVEKNLEEDVVWNRKILSRLENLPDNALNIWRHAFTEMYNNVVDHSQAKLAKIELTRTATTTELILRDNGVGIFKKIQNALGLIDERHAVLELAKGKLTTDPKRHTGDGIFFSSRMFDEFAILSGNTFFSHDFHEDDDWILQSQGNTDGTTVVMKLDNHTARTTKKVFDRFSAGDDFVFNRTVVPVRMAQYGDDKLISRSQAKRMLTRVDRFSVVLFDFRGVEEIGQAFADEIFRVFAHEHPEMQLEYVHANSAIKRMIGRVKQ